MNIDNVLDSLNSAFKADPAAIHTLLINRVPCNEALADHPDVVVESIGANNEGAFYTVGTMGLLNAVVQVLTGERVAVMLTPPDPDTNISKIKGFTKYKP